MNIREMDSGGYYKDRLRDNILWRRVLNRDRIDEGQDIQKRREEDVRALIEEVSFKIR